MASYDTLHPPTHKPTYLFQFQPPLVEPLCHLQGSLPLWHDGIVTRHSSLQTIYFPNKSNTVCYIM